MRDFKPATDNEIAEITKTLHEATRRTKSEDLLYWFPYKTTKWFLANLEEGDLENLLLFWDGSAWKKELPDSSRRKLSRGLEDFVELEKKSPDQWTEHLKGIIRIKENLREIQQPFLILIGKDENGTLIILDGNHRAVATLWHAQESGSRAFLPTCAWIGLASEMQQFLDYHHFQVRL